MNNKVEAIESMRQLCGAWQVIVADRQGEVYDLPDIAVRWAESEFAFGIV